MVRQQPLTLHGAAKGAVRTQFAALCYRMKAGKVEVLLITSRRRKRWIVPKGWPMEGKTPAACAAREAWEEAGVRGQASDTSVGVYSYIKIGRKNRPDVPVLAVLYPIRVTALKKRYPEARERRRMWVSRKKAAKLLDSKALGKLIVGFVPPEGRGPA
ncbi:NUDIX hydrolase [Sulfitobacter albidus]|uniref:NUDIX hydrolase n=1 Tax=Sulfitobacter albidus TaxID=2829501 RepID=A0A975JBW5_9RHOB|nr:NUDIX hydrolase [Sulfitobacter albidus]QUJ75639.1 NUDIX hydrolase [Sulfitobacter albidus]